MVKMKSPNRPGQWKWFKESSVDAAKANGWEEVSKPKPKKVKKAKGDK